MVSTQKVTAAMKSAPHAFVLKFNPHRKRAPKVPVPQDQLPKVDVNPPGQSIQEQLKQARVQQHIQST
jgi:hypothetical protein